MISILVAMDQNRVIGVENKLPWHLPADLKRFKRLTMGHSMVMGRKTFESIGRVLPGRIHIVVSRQLDYRATGVKVVHSLEEAFEQKSAEQEIFLIGGANLFVQGLPFCQKIYMTEIETEVRGGDAFFPVLEPSEWEEVDRDRHTDDESSKFRYSYVTYLRRP